MVHCCEVLRGVTGVAEHIQWPLKVSVAICRRRCVSREAQIGLRGAWTVAAMGMHSQRRYSDETLSVMLFFAQD